MLTPRSSTASTVTFSVKGPGGTFFAAPFCQAVAVDQNAGVYSTSAYTLPQQAATWTTLTTQSVIIPSGGNLLLDCYNIDWSSYIGDVSWTP